MHQIVRIVSTPYASPASAAASAAVQLNRLAIFVDLVKTGNIHGAFQELLDRAVAIFVARVPIS